MNEKKYIRLLCQQSNEDQKRILLDVKNQNEESLKEEFQQILIDWFRIYGENNRMTFAQFFYFWVRNTDKQASREPENISKNFFTRQIKDGCEDWDLNSFLSYFTEKSSQRPNLVLRMLLCHDYDINLKKLTNPSSLLNTYGSAKIYEEKDINMFAKREDCNKITFISKQKKQKFISCIQQNYYYFQLKRIEESEKYCVFLSKIQSLSYLYEGYQQNKIINIFLSTLFISYQKLLWSISGFFVLEEYLKLLKYHMKYIQRLDIKPLKVTSFIRVKYEEINALCLLLVGNRNISIFEFILSINFEKLRQFYIFLITVLINNYKIEQIIDVQCIMGDILVMCTAIYQESTLDIENITSVQSQHNTIQIQIKDS